MQISKANLAKRIKQLAPSPTLALDAKVKELQAKGTSIINLTVGEPDFDTPINIKKAGINAIEQGFTHYTSSNGIVELREAIGEKLKRENNISFSSKEIIVSVGTKHLLYLSFLALCDENDEVLIPTPTWLTYVEQVKLAQAKPVYIPLNPPFALTANNVKKRLTKKTKVLILNSPANPTGAVIDPAELEKIAELAIKHNFSIVSDEIYEKIIYAGKHVSIASLNKKIKEKTITINGFSKSYAMTGWRIGFAAAPQMIIDAMVALQSQITSNTSSISQKAAVAALKGNQQSVIDMTDHFQKRRNLLIKAFDGIDKISVIVPHGAFYLFVSIEQLLNKNFKTSEIWCEKLLEEKKVAVVPGEAFLAQGFFRLSFAASEKNLIEGAKRIKEFIRKYA